MDEKAKQIVTLLATWGGCGYAPKGPGTVGTLGAIPFVGLLSLTGEIGVVAVTLAFAIFSIFICQLYENIHRGHDQKEIVIDEVAGFLVTMTLVPFHLKTLAIGFVLFRFFDIAKPFPIGYLDKKVKGGFGVVVDDLVAGLLANVLLQILLRQGWI